MQISGGGGVECALILNSKALIWLNESLTILCAKKRVSERFGGVSFVIKKIVPAVTQEIKMIALVNIDGMRCWYCK